MTGCEIKWCAQGDDFRTFLHEFVIASDQFALPSSVVMP